MLLWIVAVSGGLVAVAAYLKARQLARRLTRLSQSYWELRHQCGQLQAAVERLQPGAEPAEQPPRVAFVPLSSLKR